MPSISVSNFVQGEPGPVFEHVTAYPLSGSPDVAVMESRHGRLLESSGNVYTFLENIGGGIRWECTFDPPQGRAMRATDSTWSNRYDSFDPCPGGTVWTITWELKATGLSAIIQQITFRLRDRRRVNERMAAPVIAHFQQQRSE